MRTGLVLCLLALNPLVPQMKIAEFANSVELDEVAQNAVIKPPNQKIEKAFQHQKRLGLSAGLISFIDTAAGGRVPFGS